MTYTVIKIVQRRAPAARIDATVRRGCAGKPGRRSVVDPRGVPWLPPAGAPWSFLPIGALVVDFALTIAISIAAAASALIAYVPGLAGARIPIALALVVAVAALTWFGHGGRLIFAVMTCLFIVAAVVMLAVGFTSPHVTNGSAAITHAASPALVAVILAFPVAMALA